jgi:hypothetical protein
MYFPLSRIQSTLIYSAYFGLDSRERRLSIYRPTKRGKERSPSNGHCQCEKERDDHLLPCQYFLTECHIVKITLNERTLFSKITAKSLVSSEKSVNESHGDLLF